MPQTILAQSHARAAHFCICEYVIFCPNIFALPLLLTCWLLPLLRRCFPGVFPRGLAFSSLAVLDLHARDRVGGAVGLSSALPLANAERVRLAGPAAMVFVLLRSTLLLVFVHMGDPCGRKYKGSG